MGQLNSANELLEGAVWDAGENRDVRYGAARSQIEVAVRSPEQRGAEILKSIAEKLRSIESPREDKNLLRAIKEFRSCAILDRKKSAEPGWWHEAYVPILQAGIRITAQLSAEENRRWTAQLERFVSDVRDLSD
jgi:hypothetical protein